jgi:GNAT superfamily N-acetyltransferase
MATITEQLDEFIASRLRNQWIGDEKMNVYVRRGRRVLIPDGWMFDMLDIAAVEVEPPFQRQGLWTRFLAYACQAHPWAATYLECVHNPHIRASLERCGWQEVANHPQCYYMMRM